MLITCQECKATYSIADKVIGPQGRMVKCTKCNHTWTVNTDIITSTKENQPCERKTRLFKFTSVFLFLWIILISFLFFPNFFMQFSPLKYIYEECGIHDSQGIVLEEFAFEINGSELLIQGIVKNVSDQEKFIPNVRYSLLDQNKNIIFKHTENITDNTLNPGDYQTITSKIINIPDQVAYLQIDIGNKLELLLR